MKKIFSLIALLCPFILLAQRPAFTGMVKDGQTALPLEGATITLWPGAQKTTTDERGFFYFKDAAADSIHISSIGHENLLLSVADFNSRNGLVLLAPATIQLRNITITAEAGGQYRPISKVDIKLRGINNSQEVLRMVPGLFIGQHAGGGKAEQIFLRGFDIDHGTDINISVDGAPVNMVSHAHGQGYADLHFLIPELIDNVNFKKGTYYAEKGNFTTSGFVDFKTIDALPQNTIKVEAGMFNTYRAVGMVNLLSDKMKSKGQSLFVASEAMYTKGYFDNPQDFNRINVFAKYNGTLGKNHVLAISASHFSSGWDASGQIPDRAVAGGLIGFYGAIDPNEGGKTKRSNLNALITSTLKNGGYFKNRIYYSDYRFELYSNFTFFKEDTVNGDQIKQKEHRNLYGYNGSYHHTYFAGNTKISSEMGVQVRVDKTFDSELSRTVAKTTVTDALMLGDISESNAVAYISETFAFNQKWSANAGLRYDYFHNRYLDKLAATNEKADAGIVSPKLSLYYNPNAYAQFYITSGKGFHSNDTRVVVPQNGLQILPPAYGSDLGTVLKPVKNLLVNAALWYLWLDQEFVYVGDEGVVEPSGKSRRYGADLSVRYQPLPWLYADVDLNYAYARAVDEPKGENYLPLAPRFTSIGGLTAKLKSGINAAMRYRYMGDRPANEDNSIVAEGYFVTDAFVSYAKKKYELGLSIQNLFDVQWKETQFDTESRLKNEAAAVSEIHFTPGTPFFAKLSFTYLF